MIVLVEKDCRNNLLPFSATRHVANILIGATTIKRKWELLTGEEISLDENTDGVKVPANILPTQQNFKEILYKCNNNIPVTETETIKIVTYPWHIVQYNDFMLREDIALLNLKTDKKAIPHTNHLGSPENIFIEEGAEISHSILNADAGPVYISKGAQIMDGCLIRGPFFMGENSVAKMGTKIYGATTVGNNCIIGGEIKNSVISSYSNKAHDGYLGDSVLGEWCNLGAGTSNSNVKNTGGKVSYCINNNEERIYAGNKAGLIMGDYSRAAINTSFNTGTFVGVCCNVFGEIMPPKYINNFTWGREKYIFDKAIQDIQNWMAFKNITLNDQTKQQLKELYEKI